MASTACVSTTLIDVLLTLRSNDLAIRRWLVFARCEITTGPPSEGSSFLGAVKSSRYINVFTSCVSLFCRCTCLHLRVVDLIQSTVTVVIKTENERHDSISFTKRRRDRSFSLSLSFCLLIINSCCSRFEMCDAKNRETSQGATYLGLAWSMPRASSPREEIRAVVISAPSMAGRFPRRRSGNLDGRIKRLLAPCFFAFLPLFVVAVVVVAGARGEGGSDGGDGNGGGGGDDAGVAPLYDGGGIRSPSQDPPPVKFKPAT